ncbi:MAG: ATP-dependent RNA helicase HrpA [Thermodesulfobacteriota bacterium]
MSTSFSKITRIDISDFQTIMGLTMEQLHTQENSMQGVETDPDLPIAARKDEIVEAVRDNSVVIISGETGSGKTTQIPKMMLEAGLGTRGVIGCTQPRRIAAQSVASRIAQELGEDLGGTVGYKIRFDDRSSPDCAVKIMTDGILLAEAQKDRSLRQYEAIIVDEAHERSLNIDFTLGILRRLVRKRKDLKVVITSATIDTEKFSKAFDDAPVIEVSGRMYPVDVRYMEGGTGEDEEGRPDEEDDQEYVEACADAVGHILSTSGYGDILVFLPTEQDIGETMELIRSRGHGGITVLPLFARLSAKEQRKVFVSSPSRKVVVSTNVAETSLTIPGIKYVVDTGLARIPHYRPRTRTTALPVRKISQSSANQRAGRCGRVENGICIRLYDEKDFESRPFFTSPEIVRSNLAEVILRMMSLKLGNVKKFPFIDPPDPRSVQDGFSTLLELGAIREKTIKRYGKKKKVHELTNEGRIMASIPVDPKLSRILIEAGRQGCIEEMMIIVSALSVSDPRQRPRDREQQADQKHAVFKDPASDFLFYLNLWKAYKKAKNKSKSRSALRKFCTDHFISFRRLREWEDIYRQIRRIVSESRIESRKVEFSGDTKDIRSKEYEIGGPLYTALHKSLLAGYLGNIACKKEKNLFNAAKGRQAMVFPGSALFNDAGTWIVAAEFVETSRLFARTAANIDPAWIEEMGGKLCTRTCFSPHYEKKRGEVVATEQVSIFGLVIIGGRKVSYGRINPAEANDIFIRQVLVNGETDHEFEFMAHNNSLFEEVKSLEDKTRSRGFLVTDDDIFLFYKNRLDREFSDIRTFAKYLKDKGDDGFLKMTREDLMQSDPDEAELERFPDTIRMGNGTFRLEYEFDPGAKNDGVTVTMPAGAVSSASRHDVEKLVPGLFEEKIAALIKNLPKKERKKLVPVSRTAKVIADEMPLSDKPLFTLLSDFIKKKFGLDVPATEFSEENLPLHLKMRVSVRDENGREIEASRDKAILAKYHDHSPWKTADGAETYKLEYEKDNLTAWDFPDLEDSIVVNKGRKEEYRVYPGLCEEGDRVALRLFSSKDEMKKMHRKGVKALYLKSYPDHFKALKKDIGSWQELRSCADMFGGAKKFKGMVADSIVREYFSKDFRKKKDFYDYADSMLPKLYSASKEFTGKTVSLCRAVSATRKTLKELSLKSKSGGPRHVLYQKLYNDLSGLVPENFLDIYDHERIFSLENYVTAIRVRAQRAHENPAKDQKKAGEIEWFEKHLSRLLETLSPSSSSEKVRAVEEFFWMIEEYKISVFAQEVGTSMKVSSRKLKDMLSRVSGMI